MRPAETNYRRGAAGCAKRAQFTDEQRTQSPASLDLWLAECPGYHPLWAHYVCLLVHLRPAPGVPAPVLHYPEAEYEITVWADETPEAPDDFLRWFETALRPVNLVYQFHGVTDEQARGVLEKLVRAFVLGECSADTDYRRGQVELLDAWVVAVRAQN